MTNKWFDVAINHDGALYVDGNQSDAAPTGAPVTDCYQIGRSGRQPLTGINCRTLASLQGLLEDVEVASDPRRKLGSLRHKERRRSSEVTA